MLYDPVRYFPDLYPLAATPLSDPLDGICRLPGIFADGFESGDVSSWSGSIP